MRLIDRIVLHCTSGWNNQSTYSIKKYWSDPKPQGLGWKQVGYHIIINEDGTLEFLAPLSQITNGVAGYNSNSVHICYKGGLVSVDKDAKGKVIKYHYGDTRTQAQKEGFLKAIQYVFEELKKTQDIDGIIICGHRDLSPDLNHNGVIEEREWVKTCPTFNAMDMNEYGWLMGTKALNKLALNKGKAY